MNIIQYNIIQSNIIYDVYNIYISQSILLLNSCPHRSIVRSENPHEIHQRLGRGKPMGFLLISKNTNPEISESHSQAMYPSTFFGSPIPAMVTLYSMAGITNKNSPARGITTLWGKSSPDGLSATLCIPTFIRASKSETRSPDCWKGLLHTGWGFSPIGRFTI